MIGLVLPELHPADSADQPLPSLHDGGRHRQWRIQKSFEGSDHAKYPMLNVFLFNGAVHTSTYTIYIYIYSSSGIIYLITPISRNPPLADGLSSARLSVLEWTTASSLYRTFPVTPKYPLARGGRDFQIIVFSF